MVVRGGSCQIFFYIVWGPLKRVCPPAIDFKWDSLSWSACILMLCHIHKCKLCDYLGFQENKLIGAPEENIKQKPPVPPGHG